MKAVAMIVKDGLRKLKGSRPSEVAAVLGIVEGSG